MKVIDIINKMANDKDYRPTILFLGVTFTYNTTIGDYENDRDSNYGIFTNFIIENILNDEVEVIEKEETEEMDELRIAGITTEEMENRIELKEVLNDTLYDIKEKINELV